MHLHLYTTSHCHLCEQAEAQLNQISSTYALHWDAVEIAEDEGLLAKYGLSIPVLVQLQTQLELCWPFTGEDIVHAFGLCKRSP